MDSNAYLALGLLCLGLGLLVLEVFIPSGGLLGLITVGVLIGGVCCAWAAWGRLEPSFFGAYLVVLVLGVPSALIGAFTVLPHTSLGRQVLLEAPTLEAVTPFAAEEAKLENLIGWVGQASSPLTPGGLVNIGNRRLHATSDGLLIEAGEHVEVIGVKGTQVVVRATQLPVTTPQRSSFASSRDSARLAGLQDRALNSPLPETRTTTNLDFELPVT